MNSNDFNPDNDRQLTFSTHSLIYAASAGDIN